MLALLTVTALLFTGCGPKPAPATVPADISDANQNTATAADDETTEDAGEEELGEREVWGGISGFRVFSLHDRASGAWLGSFALMDDPTPVGQADATAFGWPHGNQMEAWEWDGGGWPADGFKMQINMTASRGQGAVNVLEHELFPLTGTAPSIPAPGPNVHLFTLQVVGGGQSTDVGWLLVQTDPVGALTSLTWMKDATDTDNLIFLHGSDELHAVPLADPGQVSPAVRTIVQTLP